MVEKNYEPICHATIDRLLRRTPVRFYRLSSKPQSGLQAFDLSRITTLKFIMRQDEKLEYLLFADLKQL